MNFTETDEQQALRQAVAELGRRYGHDYTAPRARAREPLTSCGTRPARAASSGSTCPRSTAAAAPACTSWRSSARSSTRPAAGC